MFYNGKEIQAETLIPLWTHWAPHLKNLSDVVAGHCLAVHEPRRGSLDDLEAEVSTAHKLEHHVEHPLASE